MKGEFLLFIFACAFNINPSSAENGDCENLENIPNRNLIHENSLEVDPCGEHIFKRCNSGDSSNGCTTEIKEPSSATFKLIVQEYNFTAKMVKVAMMIHQLVEFFIQVRTSTGNGTFDPKSEKLGHFEDLVFPQCNSFACCGSSTKTNVARRCKDAADAPTKAAFNKNFYTMSYSWHPPSGYKGPVLFLISYSQSNSVHWENIVSSTIYVAVPPPPTRPPPQITTTTDSTSSSSTAPSTQTITDRTSTISTLSPQIISSTSAEGLISTSTQPPRTTQKTTRNPPMKPNTTKPKTLTTVTPKKLTTKITTLPTTSKTITTTKKPVTTTTKKPKNVITQKLKPTIPPPIVTTTSEPPSTSTIETERPHRAGLVLIPHPPRKAQPRERRPGPILLPPPRISYPAKPKSPPVPQRSAPKTAQSLEEETEFNQQSPSKQAHAQSLRKPKLHQSKDSQHFHDPHLGQTMNSNLQYNNNPSDPGAFHGFANSRGAYFRSPHGYIVQASPYSASVYNA